MQNTAPLEVDLSARTRDHAVVPAHILRDPGLTWAEKGLLTYLLSWPADHVPGFDKVAADGLDNPRAVRAALAALEAKGLIKNTARAAAE